MNQSSSTLKSKKDSMRTVDLFCGCGGMSLGFQEAGFELVAAFDSWRPALEVYRSNFEHPGILADLSDPTFDHEIAAYRPDVIVGGPPCQDFSSAGPNRPASKRAGMLDRFVQIVSCSRPQYFVIENVPRSRLRPVFRRCESKLHDLGYGLTLRILDASRCGVPQTRERLFLIGGLDVPDDFLGNRLDDHLSQKSMTLRDYFGSSLGTEFYFRVPTNYQRRGVFSIDEPSVTIRGVDRPIPKGYPGHPDDSAPIGPGVRAFTVLERSYIQTFPRSFRFSGTKSDLNMMIGNAVPVNLAKYVATGLMSYAATTLCHS